MSNTFENLFRKLRAGEPRKMVVANGTDQHTLEAVRDAVKQGIISAIISGNEAKIIESAEAVGLSNDLYELLPAANEQEAVEKAVESTKTGRADLIMKGLVSTDVYMKALLNKESGILPKGGFLTHLSLLECPAYHKSLLLSDVAIIPLPTREQKVKITGYLIESAHKLGILRPKVAFIAATEKIIEKIPACTDAAYLKELWQNGYFEASICDGPMGLDLAIDREAVRVKNYQSDVAADADCLLFPNIESGNVFYKLCAKWLTCEIGAIVVGTNVPAVLSSRGDSAKTKLNSIALAALNA